MGHITFWSMVMILDTNKEASLEVNMEKTQVYVHAR
jgi:hypothetical protein